MADLTTAHSHNMMPRWLPLKIAVAYAAIGRDRLKRLAGDGYIRGFKDGERGDWIFDRLSIDEYQLSKVDSQAHESALAIIRSITQ